MCAVSFYAFFYFIGNKSCVKSEYINTVEFIKRGFSGRLTELINHD